MNRDVKKTSVDMASQRNLLRLKKTISSLAYHSLEDVRAVPAAQFQPVQLKSLLIFCLPVTLGCLLSFPQWCCLGARPCAAAKRYTVMRSWQKLWHENETTSGVSEQRTPSVQICRHCLRAASRRNAPNGTAFENSFVHSKSDVPTCAKWAGSESARPAHGPVVHASSPSNGMAANSQSADSRFSKGSLAPACSYAMAYFQAMAALWNSNNRVALMAAQNSATASSLVCKIIKLKKSGQYCVEYVRATTYMPTSFSSFYPCPSFSFLSYSAVGTSFPDTTFECMLRRRREP